MYARHCLLLICTGCAVLALPAAGQDVIDREYDIKFAILYNLAKKTTWPKSAFPADKPEATPPYKQPIVIGIFEPNPFGNRFDVLVKRGDIHKRRVEVKLLTDPNNIPPCNILFIPEARAALLPTIMESIRGRPILTCGDGPGFAQKGVVVNMVERENSIKIEVNLKAAERAGLSISAEVLKLTTVTVVESERREK